jgi:putative ABC transport system permease protein
MFRRSLILVSLAIQTLRANILHTLLSTLGLVIGVAALVAILSLGDGLEQYAREQISTCGRPRYYVRAVAIDYRTDA